MKRAVQSIQRCLTILEHLNINDGATLHDVCAATGLTRGTVHRVLETLRLEQYLRKDVGSPRYWVASRVRVLSEGYREEWWIDQFATRIIRDLGQKTRWPVKLLTPSGHEMVTRVTTDFESPFTDGKFPTGFRVSLLWSAAGQAYLAFLDKDIRDVLIDAAATAPQRVTASTPYRSHDMDRLRQVLDYTRKDGFHVADHPEKSFYSLAVPVMIDAKPMGSIAIFFFRATVPVKEAVRTYLPLLQEAAVQIAAEMSRSQDGRPYEYLQAS
jgi:IclR family mhp operon transcriptional activator